MSEELTEDQITIRELRERILQLEQQIDWFNRQFFGSKSEKINAQQHPDLFNPVGLGKPEASSENPPEEDTNEPPKAPDKTTTRRRKTRSEKLPEGLEIRTTYIDPAEYLKNPAAWRLLKEEPRRHLGKDPGTFYIQGKNLPHLGSHRLRPRSSESHRRQSPTHHHPRRLLALKPSR